jgi:hypothetical protein
MSCVLAVCTHPDAPLTRCLDLGCIPENRRRRLLRRVETSRLKSRNEHQLNTLGYDTGSNCIQRPTIITIALTTMMYNIWYRNTRITPISDAPKPDRV